MPVDTLSMSNFSLYLSFILILYDKLVEFLLLSPVSSISFSGSWWKLFYSFFSCSPSSKWMIRFTDSFFWLGDYFCWLGRRFLFRVAIFFILGFSGLVAGQMRLLIRMLERGWKLLKIMMLLWLGYDYVFVMKSSLVFLTSAKWYLRSGRAFFWNCLRFWLTKILRSWNKSIIWVSIAFF